MEERDYQEACRLAIADKWLLFDSTIAELATGLGKTIVFAHVIKNSFPKRAIVLVHRDELIRQAKEKIEAITGRVCQVEQGEIYASTHHFDRSQVVIASIPTLISGPKDARRYKRFDPKSFGLVIVDETHHATAATWKETIAHFMQNPDTRLLGVTATSDRADGESLRQIFRSVAFQYGIRDAIDHGYLVPITQQFVPAPTLDYSHIKTRAGDLSEGELADVMEKEENIQMICQPTIEAIWGLKPKTLKSIPVEQWHSYLQGLGRKPRRTIVFTVSVAQAEMCASVFARAMDGVEWVCGKTQKMKRRAILERFKNGETAVCVNAQVLTEGYDNPYVELISMARPTKSRSLYTQMIGRSTRTLPGVIDEIPVEDLRKDAIARSAKPFCRVLDFVGNSGKHKLVTCLDVLGGHVSEEVAEAAKKKALEDGTPKMVTILLSNAEKELEAQRRQERIDAAERERLAREQRRKRLLARADYTTQTIDAFEHGGEKVVASKRFTRDGKEFSDKQKWVFDQAGYDYTKFTYAQGQSIIGTLMGPPSKKTAALLKDFGYDTRGKKNWECKKIIQHLERSGKLTEAATK